MKTQFDYRKRVVALSNLEAMCDHISGMSHKFEVVTATDHTVRVQYSNPDEYGNAEPITAVFPAWRVPGDVPDAKAVVLEPLKYIGCTGKNEEAWQSFFQLYDCPELFRSSPDSNDWATRYQILVAKNPAFKVTGSWDQDGCVQRWHCKGNTFQSWRDAQDWAVQEMTQTPA